MTRALFLPPLLLATVLAGGSGRGADEKDLLLVFQEKFRSGAAAWEPIDAAAWK